MLLSFLKDVMIDNKHDAKIKNGKKGNDFFEIIAFLIKLNLGAMFADFINIIYKYRVNIECLYNVKLPLTNHVFAVSEFTILYS